MPGSDARTLAAELERYWVEQARRAKEICDLLERHFLGGLGIDSELSVLPTSTQAVETEREDGTEKRRPALRLVSFDRSRRA